MVSLSERPVKFAKPAMWPGLDMQAVSDRPLCGGREPHLIRICCDLRDRSVVDIRQIAICWKTAKLIEPRRRRRFELHATSRNILHERCQCRLTAMRVVAHRL